jgi:AraC-like DNA-binding protein
MLDEIHQRYNQRLTLGALAKVLRRQSAYLGRLFREEIGVTVHEYVTRARMVFGAVQVCAGVKIEAVSLDLGYRSKKNFYRQFKRRFGMTPDAYRQGHREATCRPVPATESNNTRGIKGAPRVAMLVTDARGRYVGATETAIALTGYSVDELRELPADGLFPDRSGSNSTSQVQVLHPASSSMPANTVVQTKAAGRIRVHLTSVDILPGGRSLSVGRAFSMSAR